MSDTVVADFRFDPFSEEAMRDPQPLYRVLREEHPAYFIPEYDTWVFTRFEDVWNGYMDSEHFSEAEGMWLAVGHYLAESKDSATRHGTRWRMR